MRFFRSEKHTQHSEFRNDRETIFPIVMACMNMSKQRVGALIVLQNDIPLSEFIRTGEEVDAKIKDTAEKYKKSVEEYKKSLGEKNIMYIQNDILMNKLLTLLTENNTLA